MSVAGKIFSKRAWFGLVGFLAVFAPTARAILSGSTSDPGTPPWNYVGSIGGLSGVYLGDYNGTNWVLTAAHVGLGNFTLGNTTYSAIAGSAFSILNNDNSPADLSLFQISSAPFGLANLGIVSGNLTNAQVEMIGFGGGKSWGTNTVTGYANYTLSGYPYGGPGIVTLATTGAQGESGDSGGGMFYLSGSTWYLAGILSGVGPITINSVSYDSTISVELGAYANQIFSDINSVSAIPEPSADAAIIGIGSLLGVVIYRRRAVRR